MTKVRLVAGVSVAGLTAAFIAGSGIDLPGGENSKPMGCGDHQSFVLDARNSPYAQEVDYRKKDKVDGRRVSDQSFQGVVRFMLADGGVQIDAASDMTEVQAADPAHEPLDSKLGRLVRQGPDENPYPGTPDYVVSLSGKDVRAPVHIGVEGGDVHIGFTVQCGDGIN